MEYWYDKTTKLSYELAGTGDQPLLLFHGFGLSKEIFRSWVPNLGDRFRLITVDLFYHGESEKALGYLSKTQWKKIVTGFLEHLEVDRFSVLGFSLGGRFAIATGLLFKDRCDGMFLIGPDAVYKTRYFVFSTSPFFRPLFKFLMFNPKAMDRFVSLIVFLRISTSYLKDFVDKELGSPANRRRVYIAWNHFKPLGFSSRELNEQLFDFEGKKILIAGERDIVIKPAKLLPILVPLGFEARILSKKHHQLVKEETAKVLAECLD